MITKEKTKEFIDRAYETACKHGFHDEEKSVSHCMMLVVSEIGEMVEADRKNRHACLDKFDNVMRIDACVKSFSHYFEMFVKDTLEDELADVCIRLYDFCGEMGIVPEDISFRIDGDFMKMWDEEFGDMSVCEQCYELVSGVSSIDVDSSEEEMSEMVGASLLFCYCFAEHHGIDLERHIGLKMGYNEGREVRHGKQY